MKKTYIAPSVELVRINAVQMICESLDLKGVYNSETMDKLGRDRGSRANSDDFDELW